MDRYEHSFKTAVARVDYGRMAYHGVFLPDALLETLPDARKPGFRLKAEVAGVFITCGLMAARKTRYILLSNAFLKQAGIRAGDEVLVRFSHLSSNHVEIPYELEVALAANSRAKTAWNNLSPGKKRAHAHQVASAMQEATRQRRATRVVELLSETKVSNLLVAGRCHSARSETNVSSRVNFRPTRAARD